MAKQAADVFSKYFHQLSTDAKKRYLEKIENVAGIDPFTLHLSQPTRGGLLSNNQAAQPSSLPSIDATDLLSYLVLQTSYITTQQFKAHKSLEAYNQFVSGWIKEVFA